MPIRFACVLYAYCPCSHTHGGAGGDHDRESPLPISNDHVGEKCVALAHSDSSHTYATS
jgi:hypothetical protein